MVVCGLHPLFVTPTLTLVELELDALPDVALPPDVLPDELALPELELWELLFVTLILLLLLTLHFVPLSTVHSLLEPGPVFVIEQVAAEAGLAKSSGLITNTATVDIIPRMMVPPR